jgi:hypothetical protein
MGRKNPFSSEPGLCHRHHPQGWQTLFFPIGAYGGRGRVRSETVAKSRFSEPVYYVFDNRGRGEEG